MAIDRKLLVLSASFKSLASRDFDEFRWPLPVRPGDELHVESEVLDVRPSKSRLIKVRTTTLNQRGEAVQIHVGNLLVPRRPASEET